MTVRAEEGDDPAKFDPNRWRAAGDRIQTLLDALSVPAPNGTVARERAEQLVGEVVDLYGTALGRMVALTEDLAAVERYAADDLVASLLLVHGLHPHDTHRRVADALESVRPYLGSHGGDVELIGIVPGPQGQTARLRLMGNCRACPSSSATLELAVEDAVRAAAPEIAALEVVTGEQSGAAVIPTDSLLSRLRAHGPTAWHPVPDIADLLPGEVGGFDIGGTDVLACRIGDELFAYRDHCPSCEGSLTGAVLHRAMGSRDPVLRCPRCRAHYDVARAGAGLDHPERHLEPLPLLVRDGVLALAIDERPAGLSA